MKDTRTVHSTSWILSSSKRWDKVLGIMPANGSCHKKKKKHYKNCSKLQQLKNVLHFPTKNTGPRAVHPPWWMSFQYQFVHKQIQCSYNQPKPLLPEELQQLCRHPLVWMSRQTHDQTESFSSVNSSPQLRLPDCFQQESQQPKEIWHSFLEC